MKVCVRRVYAGEWTDCILVNGNDLDVWVLQSVTCDDTTDTAWNIVVRHPFFCCTTSTHRIYKKEQSAELYIVRPERRGDTPVDSDFDLKGVVSDCDHDSEGGCAP